jgi:penicillin-binding protein 1A
VLSNLVQSGFMTEGQVVAARRNPASVVDRAQVVSPDFFLDWAFDEVQRLSSRFSERSLIVRTTIDMSLQKASEDAIASSLLEYGEHYHASQSASVMIENGGAVRAMVGGRDYGESQFNRATKALRQPGSSFKIYTYSVAMENGMTPLTTIVDGPITWGNWSPHNFENRYEGRVTLTEAIAKSINTIPVRLAKEHFGIQPIRDMAKRLGVETPIRNDKTIPIGTSEVTVLDQATAYATFPADGMQSRRHGISQILGYNGKILYDFDRDEAPARRVLSEPATASMTQMLTQIPIIGTGRKAALDHGIVVGGKTGTTQGYRDAWFIGFTGNYTCAVWFGNDDYTSTNEMTGGTLPAMTFKKIMDYAHQGVALKPIPGIADPFPAQKPMTVAAKKAAANAAPPPVRPRSLSAESTKVLRDLGEQMKDAPPVKGERMASVAP